MRLRRRTESRRPIIKPQANNTDASGYADANKDRSKVKEDSDRPAGKTENAKTEKKTEKNTA
jgi:hypothetical protein